ncbi:hypothetical protein BDF19DRAFT_438061 [Syncephalis fuscata]|nr:hypothetical protein BDF19DRAFT_438061 [Syncephalis fuscata]
MNMHDSQRPHKRVKSDYALADSIQRYREEAISLFKQRKYTAALKYFDKCIQIAPHLLTLRDQRAATLEQLGNLKEASREGQTMMSLAPSCAIGYLRVGKCFQLSSRLSMAQHVYQAGLNAVAVDDPWRFKLISVATEVNRLLSIESKAQYLPVNKRICCMRVCSLWRTLVKSTHEFWTTIDLTATRRSSSVTTRPLRNELVQQAIVQCGHRLTRLCLPKSGQLSSTVLRTLATSTCRQLRYLELTPSSKISEESFVAALKRIGKPLEELILHAHGNWARHVWSRCPRLRRLEVTNARAPMLLEGCSSQSLHILRLVDCVFLLDESIVSIARGLPNLRILEIPLLSPAVARVVSSTSTALLTLTSLESLRGLTHLEVLVLPGIHGRRPLSAINAAPLAEVSTLNIPTYLALHTIDFSSSTALTNDKLLNMTTTWQHTLQSVTLNSLPELSDTVAITIVSSCLLLKQLHLNRCPRLTDTLLNAIAMYGRHLLDLSLHSNPNITYQGLNQLFNHTAVSRSRLTHLNISACPRITSYGISQLVTTLQEVPSRSEYDDGHDNGYDGDSNNDYSLQWISLYNCQNVSRPSCDRLQSVLKAPGIVLYGFSD